MFALIAVLLVTTGCTTSATDEAQRSGVSLASSFASPDGLLYPPELWGALSISTQAELLDATVQKDLGEPMTWVASPADTWTGLTAELPPVEAAYLMTVAGLPPAGLWSPEDIETWWEDGFLDQSIDHAWMAWTLTAASERPTLTAVQETALRDAADGSDLVPALLAGEILDVTGLLPQSYVPGAHNLRVPRDAALAFAQLGAVDFPVDDDLLADLRSAALADASSDDWSRAFLVRALVTNGHADEARRAAGQFDERRRLPDGQVLEVPQLVGSVGSSFRMLRWQQGSPAAGSFFSPEVMIAMTAATTRQLHQDLSHELAGTALLYMADRSSGTASAREDLVTSTAQTEDLQSPLDLEHALGWSSLAEYATAMDVSLPFPGITDAALAEWAAEDVAVTAPSILLFLGALDGQDHLIDAAPALEPLLDRLRTALSGSPVDELDSQVLFGASFLIHRVSGSWPVEPEVLRSQMTLRTGDCLGGFHIFIRSSLAERSVCNVESTRYADLVMEGLGA